MSNFNEAYTWYRRECVELGIMSIPSTKQLVLLADFNARVGADNDFWPSCLGPFGVGKMNENGQWLLKLCVFHNLCITNSFFKTKPQHKVSWRHLHSKHWHQLDLILVRCASIKNVLHTHSYHSTDCDTDHSLVCCKIRLQPKKFHHAKKLGNPHIDVSKMTQPDLMEQFAEAFEEEYDASQSRDTATEKWETLQDTIHHITLAIFGKKTSKSHDWYEVMSSEMTPIIEAKCAALAEYKQPPTEQNLQTLRAARSKVQCITRCCANEFWTEHSEMIQMAAVMGNIRGMYDGIKKALGPMQNKTAPLKSATGEVITDQGQQMERWVEHYSNLYSRENTVTPSALGTIKCMPIMEELNVEPTVDKLSKVIDSLATGKAPGSDSIPPDLIKHCKTTLLHPLHKFLCQCWREGVVPQDMRDAKIITLYKNKGERSDCNNYRGISLLSIVGKVYAWVLLICLQKLAECIYPESQCGFWAERSTVDMVFSLCQLQEKCREQQMPLYIAFINLTKAFDLVSRDGLFKALCKICCPPRLHSLIESFHSNMKGTVQFHDNLSEPLICAAESNKAVYLLQLSLGSSLLSSWGMHLAQHKRESSCRPDQMVVSSILPALKWGQRSMKPSSETCCLLMMSQSWHTPKGNCSCLWTTSPRPAKTSGWSLIWRRQTSWAKTYQHHQSSPLMTMSLKSFTNSHTLGPPSLITSPLTLRLTRGSGRQPQHLLTWCQECGQTPSWLWRWRWLCTMPVSSAPCSIAVRHGLHMHIRRKGSTLSTLEAYDA